MNDQADPDATTPSRSLKPLLEDEGVLKVGQNIKYDAADLRQPRHRRGGPIDDTMLLSYVIEGGLHGHGMDELAQLHLDYKTIKFKRGRRHRQKRRSPSTRCRSDKALDYAAEDADITLQAAPCS